MATFNLPGDLGTFVRSTPFDSRRKQYIQSGLNNVLGDFVGSVQQNQALYNKTKSAPKSSPTPSAIPIVDNAFVQAPTSPVPVTQQNLNPASGVGNPVPGIPPTPKVAAPAKAAPNPLDARPASALSPDELAARSGVPVDQLAAKGIVPGPQGVQQKAQNVESDTGGTTSAADIMAAVEQDPTVVIARQEAQTKKEQGMTALDRALGRLKLKSDYDKAALKTKANDALKKLYSSLERSGLAGSGFQVSGENSINANEQFGEGKVSDFQNADEQDALAKKLAQDENIDLALAKTITRAATSEIKARQAAQQKEHQAMDTYMRSQGFVLDPTDGKYKKSAAETRAEASASRVAANALKKKNTVVPTTPSGTPLSKLLSASQITGLKGAGIDQGLAGSITEDILGGITLDEIRQTLTKHGQDPKLLDKYDQIVSIAGLLAKQKNKVPKASSSSSGSRTP